MIGAWYYDERLQSRAHCATHLIAACKAMEYWQMQVLRNERQSSMMILASSSLELRVVSGVDDRTMILKRPVAYWSGLSWLELKHD